MPIVRENLSREGTMSGWEPEKSPEHWSDPDAWRGEQHQDSDDSWRGETLAVWEDEDEDETADSDPEDDGSSSSWLSDWPENLAGPEYWLYKRDGM
jgi:hypothetical protein